MPVAREKKRLVVEGYSDKRFFQGLLRHLKIEGLEVEYPGEAKKHPGKTGAVKRFELLLDEAGEPKRYESISICVDADYGPAEGFSATEQVLTGVLASRHFRMVDASRRRYLHQESGAKASFYVCPMYGSNGYLESLILQSLAEKEGSYVTEVVRPFTSALADPRFNLLNADRAILYTYLAIQKKPDKSLPTLLDDGFVDLNSSALSGLVSWLQDIAR